MEKLALNPSSGIKTAERIKIRSRFLILLDLGFSCSEKPGKSY